MKKPVFNPELSFAIDDWTGNPLDRYGNYKNIYQKSERSLWEVIKWKFSDNPQKKQKERAVTNVEVIKGKSLPEGDGCLWLGHASFFLRLAGVSIITDPVFYDLPFYGRATELPLPIEALTDIDIVLLSHNHRDHMDQESLMVLMDKNPQAIILTGLETGRLLRKWFDNNVKYQEAGWYQSFNLDFPLDITYLPAMHWTRRGAGDLNKMLWGSFLIQKFGKNIFFGADSGYGPHFKDIGDKFGIDVALLGIGAYKPGWFMHTSHTNPDEACQAMLDLKAAKMVPMHYGTFELADEPIDEPLNRFNELKQKYGDSLVSLKIGEWMAL